MAIVYLTEQQSWVSREGECLVVHIPERDEQGRVQAKRHRKAIVPLGKVEEVIVMGNITLSTPALASLLASRLSIAYFDVHGNYLGSLSPQLTKNSLLRLAQHTAYHQNEQRHVLARCFVSGKLRNMRTILMRYQRSLQSSLIGESIERLKQCITGAERLQWSDHSNDDVLISEQEITELDAEERSEGRMHGLGPLLGHEGAGSAAYFSVFAQLIRCEWEHGFSKRVRRPPSDPINAMLSYGYTVLSAQITSILAGVGFDPYVGYLHASRYGKPSLALDLMEEFRPVIVDSVVLNLLNNRQLEARDFVKELNSCRMTDATKRLFLQKFEERMQELITHPTFEYKVSYRRCIELQARLLGKYLMSEVPAYIPFTVR